MNLRGPFVMSQGVMIPLPAVCRRWVLDESAAPLESRIAGVNIRKYFLKTLEIQCKWGHCSRHLNHVFQSHSVRTPEEPTGMWWIVVFNLRLISELRRCSNSRSTASYIEVNKEQSYRLCKHRVGCFSPTMITFMHSSKILCCAPVGAIAECSYTAA